VLVVATGALRGAGLVDELCGGRPPKEVEAVDRRPGGRAERREANRR